ncbi:MAG: hypothetical protein ACREER_08735, partial [Alphaproteobacteria bacterium]
MRTRGKRAFVLLALCCGLSLGVIAFEGRAERLDGPSGTWGTGIQDDTTAARLVVETHAISRGDTLMDLLVESGIARAEAEQAIRALARYYSPRTLQIGQELTIVLDRGRAPDGGATLLAMGLAVGNGRHVVAERGADDGEFAAHRGGEPLDVARIAAALAPAQEPAPLPVPPDQAPNAAELVEDDWVLGRLVIVPDATNSPGNDLLVASRAPTRQADVRVVQVSQDLAMTWQAASEPRQQTVAFTRDEARSEPGDDGSAAVTPPVDTFLSLAVPGLTAPAFVPRASAPGASEGTAAVIAPTARPFAGSVFVEKNLSVGRGDTMAALVRTTGVDAVEAAAALDALAQVASPQTLQIGDRVKVSYQPGPDGAPGRLVGLSWISAATTVTVERARDGDFVALERAVDSSSPPLPPVAAPKAQAASWHLTSPSGTGPDQPTTLVEQVFEIGSGDTLHQILAGAGVGDADAQAVAKALRPLINLRRLDIGQDVVIVLDPFDIVSGRPRLVGLSIERKGGDFAVARRVDGSFEVYAAAQPATTAGLTTVMAEAPAPNSVPCGPF